MADKPKKVGKVIHYYAKIQVGIVKLSSELKLGDMVQFKGKATDFEQKVESMQFDHKDIDVGKKGQELGMKVAEKVKKGDEIFLV